MVVERYGRGHSFTINPVFARALPIGTRGLQSGAKTNRTKRTRKFGRNCKAAATLFPNHIPKVDPA
jgi:hypothetical protein